MFNSTVRTLKRVVENPYINLLVGFIFLGSGIVEITSELKELGHVEFGLHHGAIIFALMHILKTIPEIFEGLEYVEKMGEINGPR